MNQQSDIKNIIKQHIEMNRFFAGDLMVRSNTQPVITEKQQIKEKEVDQPKMDTKAKIEQLAQQAAQCCQCELAQTRKNVVPGEGNVNADIVFVGEAPGKDEDAQGRPFVGRAGKLLTDIINAMGLKRQDVFICNILKCRPPNNRDPKPDEIACCEPFLKKQLEIIQPKAIVALGAHAARTLLKTDKPIGKLRGVFHEYHTSENAEPIKLMPTYHPAYLVRNYSKDNRRKVWEDMKKVLTELNLPVPK